MIWVNMFHFGGMIAAIIFVIIKLIKNKEKCKSFTVVIILLELVYYITSALYTWMKSIKKAKIDSDIETVLLCILDSTILLPKCLYAL